jgi:hypothetical protein
MKLIDIKDIADIIQAVVTCFALIIGGIWSYMLFVRKRQRYPRAKIEHQVTQRIASTDATLVSINIIISNAGDVLLSLIKGEIEVRQVLPPEVGFLQKLKKDQNAPYRRVELIDWPLLFPYEEDWKKEKRTIEIEPGESEQFLFTLLIHAEVKTIYINSYFHNMKKRRKDLGWSLETFHDVSISGNEGATLPK